MERFIELFKHEWGLYGKPDIYWEKVKRDWND